MSEETPNSTDPRIHLAGKRTHLASFRTQLALDRTTPAWIRTTLTMASFGFGMVAFFRELREKSQDEETVRLHEGAVHPFRVPVHGVQTVLRHTKAAGSGAGAAGDMAEATSTTSSTAAAARRSWPPACRT